MYNTYQVKEMLKRVIKTRVECTENSLLVYFQNQLLFRFTELDDEQLKSLMRIVVGDGISELFTKKVTEMMIRDLGI